MKHIKYVTIIFISLFAFTLSSCDDEPLEGDFPTGGGGGGGGGDTTCVDATNEVADATVAFGAVDPSDANYSSVCNDYLTALQNFINACGDPTGDVQTIIDALDCTGTGGPGPGVVDYWPRAVGNFWTLNGIDGVNETYTIIGTETFDGQEFYAFDELYGSPSWIRKSGSNYFLRASLVGEIPGYQITSTPFTINIIKDEAVVGETWESMVSYTISYIPDPGSPTLPDANVDAVYDFEMIERDMTRTVEGVTYNEVIHIEMVLTALGQSIVSQYYYANNIGIIEYTSPDGSTTLVDYSLN